MPIIIQALAEAAAPIEGVIAYPPDFFAAARPANAWEMIDRLPGFAFESGAAVRGFEGAAGNVQIDGQRPATKTDDLGEVLRRIPASQVARIEVIRGGAPGVDMQGKSVLANVVRKTDGAFRGLFAVADTLSIDEGLHKIYVRLEASGGRQGHAWEAAIKGGGAFDAPGGGPRTRLAADGAPLILGRVQARAAGMPGAVTGSYQFPVLGGGLKLNGRLASDRYDFDETNRSHFPADAVEHTHDADDSDETEVGASFSRSLGPRLKLEAVALRKTKDEQFAEFYATPAAYSEFHQDSQTAETIGRVVVKFAQRPNLTWEFGTESARNTLDNLIRFQQGGVAFTLPAADVRVEENRWEAFAKMSWRPSPAWTLDAALSQEGSELSSRGDVVLAKRLTFAKPRLAAAWAPDARTQIRLSVERVVGQLDFNDFTASSSLGVGVLTAGNPDLSPEQAWVGEATVERRVLGTGAAVVTLRHSAITDVIDRAPVTGPAGVFDAPTNIGDGTKDELILNLTLPLARFGLKGAELRGLSTWRRSRVTDPATHAHREISKLNPQEWEAHLTWDLPRRRANWGLDAYGPSQMTIYRFDQVDLVKQGAYVAVFYEWKPRPDLTWRVELDNVVGRAARTTNYVYGGPRGTSRPVYVEDRDRSASRMIYLRLRKTLP